VQHVAHMTALWGQAASGWRRPPRLEPCNELQPPAARLLLPQGLTPACALPIDEKLCPLSQLCCFLAPANICLLSIRPGLQNAPACRAL
jgi:hypothetical protein